MDPLADLMVEYADDPEGFARDAYRWGEGQLANHPGPRAWQANILQTIGNHLKGPNRLQPLCIAVASGHGIGKSGLVGMVIDWAMSTCPETRCVVTANTEAQLRTKTWPEISKWVKLAENSDWWSVPAMSMYEKAHEKSWRADATPWSENNTEAFAGLHNEGKRIVLVFDEASKIADKVWEVAEGALTDENTEIIWLAFGNPTQATGRFRECFGKYRHLWVTKQIDSRTVEGTNKTYLNRLVETYGEDSDIVKVRVRGQFPSQSFSQFIGFDRVKGAQQREPGLDKGAALVMGVDIARFGDDQCVIRYRKGRDATVLPPVAWRGKDTSYSANRIAGEIDLHKPQAIFIDGGGVGGGVIDQLRHRGYTVREVQFGAAAGDEKVYANKRAEIWGLMKEWLPTGAIDESQELHDDLTGPEFSYDKQDRILLESKKDMKERGLASPDHGDALACTFAEPVARLDTPSGAHKQRNAVAETADPFD